MTVFEDSKTLFPNTAGFGGPRSEFELLFSEPLDPTSIGPAPFDPILFVRNNGRVIRLLEVDASYKDEEGFPFGMLLTVNWQPPLEYIDIRAAYPLFTDFVSSEGNSSSDWYDSWFSNLVFKTLAPDVWAWQ